MNETTTTRRIGQNRGKARLWLEGALLQASGWVRGTRYNCRFEDGVVVYEQDENGSRKVAGTDERPIIDTNTDKLRESLGQTATAKIVIVGRTIRATAAALAVAAGITFGFFPAHAKSVLVGCEFSGTVRDAFAARGHDAVSCDLIETERPNGTHIRGDLLEVISKRCWDMVIAFPPCTYLCRSGWHWVNRPDSWELPLKGWPRRVAAEEAALFFEMILMAPVPQIAVENPRPISHVKLPEPTQTIQPWMFGHGETKATCLWLVGLPKLVPTNVVDGRKNRIHFASPGKDRWKERSRTFTGIARAMAEQWG